MSAGINKLAAVIHEDAVAHGLFNDMPSDMAVITKRLTAAHRVWDEVKEAIHAACDSEEHFAEELADVVITVLSYSAELGIDIEKAIDDKVEVNRMRPYGHINESLW